MTDKTQDSSQLQLDGTEASGLDALSIDGVRGQFDTSLVKDYLPSNAARDPLMRVESDNFEGPLDLLLYIIKRDGLDLFDIPIGRICETYNQALSAMQDLNLDVAAEFLLMASTLAHIKSKMLLPKDERQDDDEDLDQGDPRAELVRRLLEYQKYRSAAQTFAQMPWLGRDRFCRPERPPQDSRNAALLPVEPMKLVATLAKIFARSKKEVVHEVFIERMSVGARINELIDVFRQREHISYEELMAYGDDSPLRSKRVVTFIALLEMTRLHLIQITQPSDRGTIYITPIHANLDVDTGAVGEDYDLPQAKDF